jgi:protein-tyrosine phosphatase
LGNICRSPLAAGIMKSLYMERQIEGVVESAGTQDWNLGRPADARSVKIAAAVGIDIRDHRGRQICYEDFDRFDVIYVMDREIERSLRAMAPPEAVTKIRRIKSLIHDCDIDVPDPYHGDERHFRQVFDMLHEYLIVVAGVKD